MKSRDAMTASISLIPAICQAANAKMASMSVGGMLPSAHSKLRSTRSTGHFRAWKKGR